MAPQNSRYGRRSKYFKVSSALDAQEKARLSNARSATPPAQLAKPIPLPFWSLPVWISPGLLLKQQPLNTFEFEVPQTEPLDLSLKK